MLTKKFATLDDKNSMVSEANVEEFRGFARRVTDATKEIAGLIDNIQKGVNESVKASVKAVEEGTTEVEHSVELAE